MTDIVISQLWIYPIKSLKGISLENVQLERRGFQYDRRWMLVDSDNHFITQRQYPKMALIEVELSDFGLSVRAPDMPCLIIPYPDNGIELYDEMQVSCWNDSLTAKHINTAIDNWFSEALGVDCQLVYMPDETLRPVDPKFSRKNDIASFSDGFPNLIISEASLEDLNQRIKNNPDVKLDKPLSMKRFRPNIVINGCEAYAEDTMKHFQINQIDFYAVKPCSRCVITTIDPQTGKKSGTEPIKTLYNYRKKANKAYFGQNLIHKLSYINDNRLKIGDSLVLLEVSSEIQFD
jgi:uncharacterized protein YcbX